MAFLDHLELRVWMGQQVQKEKMANLVPWASWARGVHRAFLAKKENRDGQERQDYEETQVHQELRVTGVTTAYPDSQASRDTEVKWVRKDHRESWDYQEAEVNQENLDLGGFLDNRDRVVIMDQKEDQVSVDNRVYGESTDHQE